MRAPAHLPLPVAASLTFPSPTLFHPPPSTSSPHPPIQTAVKDAALAMLATAPPGSTVILCALAPRPRRAAAEAGRAKAAEAANVFAKHCGSDDDGDAADGASSPSSDDWEDGSVSASSFSPSEGEGEDEEAPSEEEEAGVKQATRAPGKKEKGAPPPPKCAAAPARPQPPVARKRPKLKAESGGATIAPAAKKLEADPKVAPPPPALVAPRPPLAALHPNAAAAAVLRPPRMPLTGVSALPVPGIAALAGQATSLARGLGLGKKGADGGGGGASAHAPPTLAPSVMPFQGLHHGGYRVPGLRKGGASLHPGLKRG